MYRLAAFGLAIVFSVFLAFVGVAQAAPITVSLTAPTSGQSIAGLFRLNATTSKNATRVEYYVDNVKVAEDLTKSDGWDEEWNSTTVPDGAHQFKAIARDSSTSKTSTIITANVANVITPPPPTTTTTPPPTTTTTPPPTTTTPPPPAGPVPTGVAGNWTLSFQDNFDGTTLDTTKWMPYWYVDGGVQNNVPTRASNVSVGNGELKLILSDANNGASINTDISSGYKFPVGSCTEARVFFPGSETTAEKIYNFPAWWVAPVMNTWPSAGEHDIAEGLGGELTVNYHSPSGAHNFGAIPGDWNNAFHVYTVCRKTASADVYWDGALVKSYPTDDNGNPEILIVNIGRSNSRTPVLGDAGAIRVDYVRAWAPA